MLPQLAAVRKVARARTRKLRQALLEQRLFIECDLYIATTTSYKWMFIARERQQPRQLQELATNDMDRLLFLLPRVLRTSMGIAHTRRNSVYKRRCWRFNRC